MNDFRSGRTEQAVENFYLIYLSVDEFRTSEAYIIMGGMLNS